MSFASATKLFKVLIQKYKGTLKKILNVVRDLYQRIKTYPIISLLANSYLVSLTI